MRQTSRRRHHKPAASQDPPASLDIARLFRAAQVLSGEMALPQLIDTLSRILIESAGAQRGCLLLHTKGQWQIAGGASTADAGSDTNFGSSSQAVMALDVARRVAQSHEPLLGDDLLADASLSQDAHAAAAPYQAVLGLPLLCSGELEGVFYLESQPPRQSFARDQVQPLMMLAGLAAIALRSARLAARLEHVRDEVAANEQRFQLLFENAPLSIFEIDISSDPPTVRTANRRSEATFGWSAAELAALDATVLVPDESRHEIGRLVETVRAGKTAVVETSSRRRDGTHFPVRLIATPAMDQQRLHMIVAVEDITAWQQRRSEAQAIDEERRRIAQEIHDGVAQDLAALRLKLSLWRDWIGSDPGRMPIELDQMQDTLDKAIDEIRRSIYAMRPLALETMGLLPALRRIIADFNDQHDIYVELQIDIAAESVPAELDLPIFRVVQEALNNIARHAGASLVWLCLASADDRTLSLTIRDNGQGFDVATLPKVGRQGHLGLMQMRERVEAVGGELTVASQPGKGTEIQASLPLG
jgi:PAS domain S-box-containing protein